MITMIGAHPTPYVKSNAQKDIYFANMNPLTPRDARSSQAAYTKERTTTTCSAKDIAHQSAQEVKPWYLLDMTLMAVSYHLFVRLKPKKSLNQRWDERLLNTYLLSGLDFF